MSLRMFDVPGEAFYGSSLHDRGTIDARDRCRAPVEALIARYGVAGRSVLSVGAGSAFEEHWFWRAGCAITLVDIDEYGAIAPTLAALAGDGVSRIRYVIGDAREYLREPARFGCCYFSSLTTDELRRRDIQQAFRPLLGRIAQGVNARLVPRLGFGLRTWPPTAEPYDDIVDRAVRHALEPGGLFIHQSYAYGVDPVANPHWISLVRRQLGSAGVELLELYCFDPQRWVTLTVGLKGTPEEARAMRERLAHAPALTAFHGRHPEPHSVVRVA